MSVEGKIATVNRQKARRAVVAGRARWLFERPKSVDVRIPQVGPTRHVRRGFGEGILASRPTYRMPVAASDLAWWEEKNQREEDAMLDRMFLEFQAQERLCAGLDF